MHFMAHVTFVPDPAIPSLVPAERARVTELARQGTLQALYLAADNVKGWLVLRGASQAEVEQTLASLPSHPYMRVDLTPLHPDEPLAPVDTSAAAR
jgi:muconolactone delta-isomerase